ncbi:hypothetical protein STEG23_001807 [Scotinomys teguina]
MPPALLIVSYRLQLASGSTGHVTKHPQRQVPPGPSQLPAATLTPGSDPGRCSKTEDNITVQKSSPHTNWEVRYDVLKIKMASSVCILKCTKAGPVFVVSPALSYFVFTVSNDRGGDQGPSQKALA